MTREHVFAAFFFAALIVLAYQFVLLLREYLTAVAWAALLALVFYPVQRWLTSWTHARRGLAAALLTTAVIGFVMVPVIYLFSVVATESVTAYVRVEKAIQSGSASAAAERVHDWVRGVLGHYVPDRLQSITLDLPSLALNASQVVSGFLVAQASGAVANLLLFVINFFLTTVVLFFFLRDGEQIVAYLRSIIPMEPGYRDALLARLSDTLVAVVVGTVVTATVQGVLATIAYWAVSLPFPVLLGFASAILSLLPGGIALIWVPVAGYLAYLGLWGWTIGFAVWFVLVVGTADNFLRPLIIGGRVPMPTLLLFLGLLGGLQVYGMLGLFLGPAVLALFLAFLQIYAERYVSE